MHDRVCKTFVLLNADTVSLSISVSMVDLLQCDPNNLVWSAILTLAFFGALRDSYHINQFSL